MRTTMFASVGQILTSCPYCDVYRPQEIESRINYTDGWSKEDTEVGLLASGKSPKTRCT